MLGYKLQRLCVFLIPLFISFDVLAAGAKNRDSKEDGETEAEKQIETPPYLKDSSVTAGFGFMRAYRARHGLSFHENLRANGAADVKIAVKIKDIRKNRPLYGTFRYLPFNISPNSVSGDSTQEYAGSINAYALGAELHFDTKKKFEFLCSLELGFYVANFAELIAVTEVETPVKKFGALFIAGGEMRYKIYDNFTIGPRLYFGFGNINLVNLMLSASFYL